MKRLVAFLILFAVAGLFAADEDKYITGAVKVLISKQERDTFKKLKTDAEREQFINEFWQRWDPSPGTPENEFKKQFDGYVQEVNDLKIPSKKRQGVDTDMGQLLVLFGQPTEQKKEEEKQRPSYGDEEGEEEAPAAPRQKQVWIYRELPAGVASGEVQIEFVADPGTGEWRFADKKKAEALLEKGREHQVKLLKDTMASAKEAVKVPQIEPSKQPAMPLATPALSTALESAVGGNPSKDIAFESLTDGFMSSKGELFGTVAVRSTVDTTAAKVGIRILDAAGSLVKEMELPFVNAAKGEETGYFQTQFPLTAGGDYTVLVAVAAGDKTGAAKASLRIPDSVKFSVSSIILSKKFTQLTEASPEMEPYTFGKIKVHPSTDHVFVKQDEMTLIYEVYNFGSSPATSKPDLEATVTFTMGKNTPSQSYPITGEKHLVVGKRILIPQAFALTNFPVGTWTIDVTVKDKVSGETASSKTQFTLK